jgi:hypothetical protein
MTPEAQRIAIAEACGYTHVRIVKCIEGPPDHCIGHHPTQPHSIPDYLNDLNAMNEVEKVIVPSSEYTLSSYMFELSKIVIPAGSTRRGLISEYIFHATAAQRAEAFLRTIGKWEE